MKPPVDDAKSLICVVDDDNDFREMVCDFFHSAGYRTTSFSSGFDALKWVEEAKEKCDLIISDVGMPDMTGYEFSRRVRSLQGAERIPLIMVTGKDPATEKVTGINAGADDFIKKPFRFPELLAKVGSLLKIREDDREKFKQISRFISPNVVELLNRRDLQTLLKPHRSEVSVVFIDLRSFSSFSENAEPEEVLQTLNHFYSAIGDAATKHSGTLGYLAGDGVMTFFNDPKPVEHHRRNAMAMAISARDALAEQRKTWQEKQYHIDFGIGLGEGYASIGSVGYERFWQYSVIGSVTNFASRLCQMANQGQILLSHRFLARSGVTNCVTEPLGQTDLKGFTKPVSLFNLVSIRSE